MYKNKFKAGGVQGSTFTLISAILGSGTVTLPFLAAKNGLALASILIIFGAIISYISGMFLVRWAEKVGSDKYEDFANYWHGRKAVIFTGFSNVSTLLGFVVNYIVFMKILIPQILILCFGEENIPDYIGKEKWKGELVWASIYTFLILLPLWMPRKINMLRYNSLFGVLCTIYLVLWLMFLFFTDRKLVPSISDNFRDAKYFNISYDGLTYSVPYVVFAFMFQPNVPMVYRELIDRDYKIMAKVASRGSIIVILIYIIAWIFGYLWLVNQPEQLDVLLEKFNILEVDYENWAFNIAVIALIFAIFAAAPVAFLPTKDTIEELFYSEKGMSNKQNYIITAIMVIGCYIWAVVVPGIGDVITILGFTTNPLIGFILPWYFYLRIVPEASLFKKNFGMGNFAVYHSSINNGVSSLYSRQNRWKSRIDM